MTYNGLWTINGQLMHLFLNGFHPLIPWLAFLFLGIALGRHLQSHPKSTLKLGLGALVMAVSVELISAVLLKLAIQNGINVSEIKPLLGTTPMPPLPQYVLAAGGCSVAVICGCRWVGDKLRVIEYCVLYLRRANGALTLYFARLCFYLSPSGLYNLKIPAIGI